VIERLAGDDPDAVAEFLATHYSLGANYEKAWRYAVVAGDKSRSRYANNEAAEQYRIAADVSRRIDDVTAEERLRVLEALGDVCETAGRYEEAERAYQDTRDLAGHDPEAQGRLMAKLGLIREKSGHLSVALRWFRRGLNLVTGSAAAGEAKVELSLAYGGVRFRQGRFRDTIAWCNRALEEPAMTDKQRAHALYLLVTAYAHIGSPLADEAGREALEIYERIGDLVGTGNVLNNLGVHAYYRGDWDQALDLWSRSEEARRKSGDLIGATTSVNNLAEIYSDQGRYEEAAEMFRTALRVWRSAHFPVGIALATSNLGRLAARLGNHEKADETLREAIGLFEQQGAGSFVAEAMTRLAENYVLAGDSERGLDTIKATLDRLSGGEAAQVLMPTIRLVRAYALAQQHRWDEAIADLTEAVRQAVEAHGNFEHALALDALCRVTAVSGIKTPDSCAADAQRIFTQLGVVRTPEVPLPVVTAG
jgi:tetratricopeptide (TPR) repeat protein